MKKLVKKAVKKTAKKSAGKLKGVKSLKKPAKAKLAKDKYKV
jgi:hypothetical protein